MATRNTWKIVSLAVIMMFFVPSGSIPAGKIDAKIDILVFMAGRYQYQSDNEGRQTAVIYKKLATYFEFGQDKVRFAIAQTPYIGYTSKQLLIDKFVLMNLSDNQALYDKVLDGYTIPKGVLQIDIAGIAGSYWIQHVNWTLKTDILDKSTSPRRAKALITIYKPHYIFMPRGTAPAAIGAWVYNVKNQIWQVDYELNIKEVEAVKEAIRWDLCNYPSAWDDACRYLEKGSSNCSFETWTSSSHPYMNKPEQCDDLHPKKTELKNCTNDECEKECNRRWPVNCTGECGQQVARSENAPEKMEHCQKWIDCPPCATTGGPDGPGGKSTDTSVDGTGGGSTGWIIGGVLGSIAVLVLVVVGVVAMRKKPKVASDKSVATSMKKKSGGDSSKPIPTSGMNSGRAQMELAGKEIQVAAGGKGGEVAVAADLLAEKTMRGKGETSKGPRMKKGQGKSAKGETSKGPPMKKGPMAKK